MGDPPCRICGVPQQSPALASSPLSETPRRVGSQLEPFVELKGAGDQPVALRKLTAASRRNTRGRRRFCPRSRRVRRWFAPSRVGDGARAESHERARRRTPLKGRTKRPPRIATSVEWETESVQPAMDFGRSSRRLQRLSSRSAPAGRHGGRARHPALVRPWLKAGSAWRLGTVRRPPGRAGCGIRRPVVPIPHSSEGSPGSLS